MEPSSLPFSLRMGLFVATAGNFLPFVPPAAHFSQQLEKWAKEPPKTNGFWISFCVQEHDLLWAVKGIDSATDPLPLPLRRRKYYVYRRGIRIPTTSLRTVCTVVSADFQPRCGVKVGTLS